jgi:inhibitor of KinA
MQIIPLSSISLLIVFGDSIEIAINEKVMALHFLLKQKQLPWIKELTPAYSTLGVTYDLHFIKTNFNVNGLVFDWAKKAIEDFLKEPTQQMAIEKKVIEIPVCFDVVLPNDLPIMSKTLGLPIPKIIEIFLSKTYHVFMLGFLPGFAYMGEVDKEIAIPRKATPTPTKAGAVGIAGTQTGIYPLDSLGGWHILGHTPINIFNPENNPPNFIQNGNKIKFVQVYENQYIKMNNKTIN